MMMGSSEEGCSDHRKRNGSATLFHDRYIPLTESNFLGAFEGGTSTIVVHDTSTTSGKSLTPSTRRSDPRERHLADTLFANAARSVHSAGHHSRYVPLSRSRTQSSAHPSLLHSVRLTTLQSFSRRTVCALTNKRRFSRRRL